MNLIVITMLAISGFCANHTNKPPKYEVYFVSRNLPVTKSYLNKALISIRDAKSLNELMQNTLKSVVNGTIKVLDNEGDKYSILVYKYGANTATSTPLTTLGSRQNEEEVVYKQNDFRTIFKDTLVVIDTLKIELRLQDVKYNPRNYALVKKDFFANKMYSSTIPYYQRNLILYAEITNNLTNNSNDVVLYNTEAPSRHLGDFCLVFLNKSQKEELLDLLLALFRAQPVKNIDELTTIMGNYITLTYGKPLDQDLHRWIQFNKNKI